MTAPIVSPASATARASWALPTLKCLALKSLEIKGSIQKLLQRNQVSVPISCGRCGRWVTANVPGGEETS